MRLVAAARAARFLARSSLAAVANACAELPRVLSRLSRWENLEHAKKIWIKIRKDRVVRLVDGRILAESMSMQAACQAMTPKLSVSWYTAKQWTQQARREGRVVEPMPEDLAVEVVRLRREVQQLRNTNELLKAASAFSSELEPQTQKMIPFTDLHRGRVSI